MKIELDKLAGRESNFIKKFEPEEISLDDEDVRINKPVEIECVIKRSEARVNLRGRIKAGVKVPCDRCLIDVDVDIDNEFDVDFVSGSIYDAANALELNEDDLNLSVLDTDAVDVEEFAREQLYLALPSHIICKTDCLGLCDKCRANRNIKNCECDKTEIDPRWAGLKDLLK